MPSRLRMIRGRDNNLSLETYMFTKATLICVRPSSLMRRNTTSPYHKGEVCWQSVEQLEWQRYPGLDFARLWIGMHLSMVRN
jgi:hypothetical protein